MANLTAHSQAKKDVLSCLGIWLTLELICFTVLPLLELLRPGDRFQTWFIISLPMGVGGALLAGIGTQLPFLVSDRPNRLVRSLLWIAQQLSVWLGLTGMAFPLLVVCIEVFTELITRNIL
jgi:hypothetical protein